MVFKVVLEPSDEGGYTAVVPSLGDEALKITVPAHKPVKRSTLSHILKQARIDVDPFIELL